MDQKSTIRIYNTTRDCPVKKFSDLLVYSVLVYLHREDRPCSTSGIAAITSLSRNAVLTSVNNLVSLGLIQDGKPQFKPEWFQVSAILRQRLDEKEKPYHWSQTLTNWTTYLAKKGNKQLSPYSVALWSYLYYRRKKAPRWTIKYLSVVLRMDRTTILANLDRLVAAGFLLYERNGTHLLFTLWDLEPDQLELFTERKQPKEKPKAGTIYLPSRQAAQPQEKPPAAQPTAPAKYDPYAIAAERGWDMTETRELFKMVINSGKDKDTLGVIMHEAFMTTTTLQDFKQQIETAIAS